MNDELKYIDAEEKKLIELLDDEGWESIPSERRQAFVEAAHNTMAKDTRMNIRISTRDYEGLKLRAAEEGMPYQTLVASILHKYVSGRLVEE